MLIDKNTRFLNQQMIYNMLTFHYHVQAFSVYSEKRGTKPNLPMNCKTTLYLYRKEVRPMNKLFSVLNDSIDGTVQICTVLYSVLENMIHKTDIIGF